DFPVASRGEQFLKQRDVRAGLRRAQPDCARQRQPEHGKAVGHPDAQMDAKRRRGNEPAVVAGCCDGPFPIEDTAPGTGHGAGATDCRHSFLPCAATLAGYACRPRSQCSKPINGSATILLPAANLSGSAGIAKAHPKGFNTSSDSLCSYAIA